MFDTMKDIKASCKILQRLFKITNVEVVAALPTSHTIVAFWIHDMFDYFEPEVIEELRNAKSRIMISFDGWGSKHEKISVVGVVVHFIDTTYHCVTRLIGLPKLPNHKKKGVSIHPDDVL